MSDDKIDFLPIWKKRATVGERLRELAFMADKNPDKFANMVVAWSNDFASPDGLSVRYVTAPDEMRVVETLGLLKMMEYRLLKLVHHEDIESLP